MPNPSAGLTAAVVLLAACGAKPSVTEVSGQCGDVFGGTVCTWARMEADRVLAVGATVPIASIEGAPADAEMAWPPAPTGAFALPEAAQRATGLTHLTVFWEPHGHPPGAFLTPHFDFHFYGVAPERRLGIDCTDTGKPAALPAGYELRDEEIPGIGLLVGICVPQMGMHSVETTALDASSVFDATMVVGYYQGDAIFTEPMIARAYLLKRQDFTLPMPHVVGPTGMPYPASFTAVYDAAAQAYRFEFSGFGT